LRIVLKWPCVARREPPTCCVSTGSSPTTRCTPRGTTAHGWGKSRREGARWPLEAMGRASKLPRKRRLLRGGNRRWVDRQLQVPQDFLDDASLGYRRDDPQRALLTHRAAFHVHRKHPREQSRPGPVWHRATAFGLFHALLTRRRDNAARSLLCGATPRVKEWLSDRRQRLSVSAGFPIAVPH
jgi:hypothetical protein